MSSMRLFNEYNYGSYLLYEGIPVFIDSRADLYAPEFNGTRKEDISKLIITASGGSLRDKSQSELLEVTKEEVLNHPNWKMGEKITVDSATLMNKAFELIEASYLFDIDIDLLYDIIRQMRSFRVKLCKHLISELRTTHQFCHCSPCL